MGFIDPFQPPNAQEMLLKRIEALEEAVKARHEVVPVWYLAYNEACPVFYHDSVAAAERQKVELRSRYDFSHDLHVPAVTCESRRFPLPPPSHDEPSAVEHGTVAIDLVALRAAAPGAMHMAIPRPCPPSMAA
jgi:hypothetical protein